MVLILTLSFSFSFFEVFAIWNVPAIRNQFSIGIVLSDGRTPSYHIYSSPTQSMVYLFLLSLLEYRSQEISNSRTIRIIQLKVLSLNLEYNFFEWNECLQSCNQLETLSIFNTRIDFGKVFRTLPPTITSLDIDLTEKYRQPSFIFLQ